MRPAQQQPPAPETPGQEDRRNPRDPWYLVWRATCALILAWLLVCGWLARPVPPWASNKLGAWSGKDSILRPDSLLSTPRTQGGSEVAHFDSDPALRFTLGSEASLGRLPLRLQTFTLAGWIRTPAPTNALPPGWLVVQQLEGDRSRVLVGFTNQQPTMVLQARTGDGRWTTWATLLYPAPLLPDSWTHIACQSDGQILRLFVDGKPSADTRHSHPPIAFASIRANLKTADTIDLPFPSDVNGSPLKCAQEDLIVFDRLLGSDEVAAIASVPPGGLRTILLRPDRSRRCWQWGWPIAIATLSALLAFRFVPGIGLRSRNLIAELRIPENRAARWTATVGLVATCLFAGTLEYEGFRMDAARFTELLARFELESHGFWSHLDQLLQRSRDWWATHPNASNADWEAWLESQHYPGTYDGVLGIGCAVAVAPEAIPDLEVGWHQRNGSALKVRPSVDAPRVPMENLAGNPRMPVVLYAGHDMPKPEHSSRTNHLLFGWDLLHIDPADLRPWAQARRIELALTLNEIRMSSLESIAPAEWYGREIRGLRLFQPVLRKPGPPESTPVPLNAYSGVVFASIDFQAIVRERLAMSPPQLGYRVSTGDSHGSHLAPLVDTDSLLPETADTGRGPFRFTHPVPFYHDTLWIDFWATDLFYQQSPRRWARWTAGAGLLATVLATTLLLVQTRARVRQSLLLAELADSNESLRNSERERTRLSRNLHDGTIQNLYAVGLHLQHAHRHVADASPRALDGIEDSQRLIQESIVELRGFVLALEADRLASQPLSQVLGDMLQRFRGISSAGIHLELDPAADRLEPWTAVHLSQITREAVSNAIRHANPTHISVRLQPLLATSAQATDPVPWRLSITDDGCGFLPSATTPGQGRGLRNLSDRSREIGGELKLESTHGVGTALHVTFHPSMMSPSNPGSVA